MLYGLPKVREYVSVVTVLPVTEAAVGVNATVSRVGMSFGMAGV